MFSCYFNEYFQNENDDTIDIDGGDLNAMPAALMGAAEITEEGSGEPGENNVGPTTDDEDGGVEGSGTTAQNGKINALSDSPSTLKIHVLSCMTVHAISRIRTIPHQDNLPPDRHWS